MSFLVRTLLGASAGLALAGSASAAVVVTSIPGAPDPGPLPNETYVLDFDSGLPAGVTVVGDAAIVSGDLTNVYAAPAGDATPYLTAPRTVSSGTAELDFEAFLGGRDIYQFSIYWGSIDTYNTLELLDRFGNSYYTIAGPAIPPADGNQDLPSTNRRVVFTLTGSDQELGGLRLTSTQYAFETDTYSFAVVPEPSSWAMMIAGFGMAGAVLRSRRRSVRAA